MYATQFKEIMDPMIKAINDLAKEARKIREILEEKEPDETFTEKGRNVEEDSVAYENGYRDGYRTGLKDKKIIDRAFT